MDVNRHLAQKVAEKRARRGWSLADLAARSGVSKAMISKIERAEVSATATVLSRLATAFGVTLAELLTENAPSQARKLSAGDQPTWVDPATGYLRRQVFIGRDLPLEMVEVELPAGAAVAIPASSYTLIRQVVWLLAGRLEITEGAARTSLASGDRLQFGPPADCVFRNSGDTSCRYLVAVIRT